MRFLLAAALVCVPLAASALSCTPHSVQAAFQQAQAAEARFVVVRGMLDFDVNSLPKVDFNNQHKTPALTRIKARLNGQSLSRSGFSAPFDREVTLAVSCFGPWCAQPSSGREVLAFVELSELGGVVATDPCGGYLFGAPSPAVVRTLKRCFAGKACKTPR